MGPGEEMCEHCSVTGFSESFFLNNENIKGTFRESMFTQYKEQWTVDM